MEAFSSLFTFMAGVPAIAGLFLAALVIVLASDWRASLAALLGQYILAGLVLVRFAQIEIVIVKILTGTLAVLIFYLTAQHIRLTLAARATGGKETSRHGPGSPRNEGPMGLVLRILAVLLVFLALVRLLQGYQLPFVSTDIAYAAIWLCAMGVLGLVLGGGPLRTAPAVLTILIGFDMVFATLEPSLAVTGFYATLILLAALAFSYLALVQTLAQSEALAPIKAEASETHEAPGHGAEVVPVAFSDDRHTLSQKEQQS
jgi:hypothetical protein